MTTDELNIKITANTGDAAQNIQNTTNELDKLDKQAETTGADMSALVEAISTIAGAASQVSAAISSSVSGFAVFNAEVSGASGEINNLAGAASASALALNGINDAATDFSGNMTRLDSATAGTADNMTALQSELTNALSSINSFSQNITSAGNDAEDAAKKIKELSDKVNQIPAGGNVTSLAAGFKTLKGVVATLGIGAFIKSSNDAYVVQMQNELKLTAHMKQRMNATNDEVNAIKKLAAEQQKLGIIGDEIQLAGAQQLTTYAKQTSTLETLLPAMNNLIAQQAGYEASVGDATSAANALGRALNGQYTSLRQYGIVLTEAQKNILQYGTESEKAALLADAINKKVGNMNYLLAQVPTGKLKQLQNELGDFKEELGALWQPLIEAYVPIAIELLETIKQPIKDVVTGLTVIGQALSELDSPAVRTIALAAAGIAVLSKLSLLIGGTSAGLLLLGVVLAGVIGSMQEEQTDVGKIVEDAMAGAEAATDTATDAMNDYTESVGDANKAITRLAGFDTLTKLSGASSSSIFGAGATEAAQEYADAIKEATKATTDFQSVVDRSSLKDFSFDLSSLIQGGLDLSKDFWSLIFGDDNKKREILNNWNENFVKPLFGDQWSKGWQEVGAAMYNIFSGDDSLAYQGWQVLNGKIKDLFGEDFTSFWNGVGSDIFNIINGDEYGAYKGWKGIEDKIIKNVFGEDFVNYFENLGKDIYNALHGGEFHASSGKATLEAAAEAARESVYAGNTPRHGMWGGIVEEYKADMALKAKDHYSYRSDSISDILSGVRTNDSVIEIHLDVDGETIATTSTRLNDWKNLSTNGLY